MRALFLLVTLTNGIADALADLEESVAIAVGRPLEQTPGQTLALPQRFGPDDLPPELPDYFAKKLTPGEPSVHSVAASRSGGAPPLARALNGDGSHHGAAKTNGEHRSASEPAIDSLQSPSPKAGGTSEEQTGSMNSHQSPAEWMKVDASVPEPLMNGFDSPTADRSMKGRTGSTRSSRQSLGASRSRKSLRGSSVKSLRSLTIDPVRTEISTFGSSPACPPPASPSQGDPSTHDDNSRRSMQAQDSAKTDITEQGMADVVLDIDPETEAHSWWARLQYHTHWLWLMVDTVLGGEVYRRYRPLLEVALPAALRSREGFVAMLRDRYSFKRC